MMMFPDNHHPGLKDNPASYLIGLTHNPIGSQKHQMLHCAVFMIIICHLGIFVDHYSVLMHQFRLRRAQLTVRSSSMP